MVASKDVVPMPAFKVPEGEVLEVMGKLGIGPEGFAVRLASDDIYT